MLVLLTSYAAQSEYCYAQANTDVMGRALRFEADSPRQLLIGATDAGYLAYWSRREVVNLDGIANARVPGDPRGSVAHIYR